MDRKLDPTDASDEDLRRSTWYLAQAQRVAHVGYWDRDLDAGRLTLSDESCRIFGLPPQRHVDLAEWHERWLKLIHPEDRPKIAEAAAAALRGGPPYDVEYRVLRPVGDVRIVHSRAEVTWDASGRPRRMFGVMQDVTDLRRAEERLREITERFQAMAESSLVGIYLIQDGLLRYVNPAMARMFGYAVEEMVDRLAPLDVVHPDDRARVDAELRRRIEGHIEEARYEFRGRRKDGSVFPVEVHGRRIDLGGRPAVMGALLDNTERRRAERELRRSQTYLAEAQRISRTGSFGWDPSRAKITWSDETHRIFGLDPGTAPSIALVLARTHPEDRAATLAAIQRAEQEGTGFDLEHRLLMPDGSVKHLHVIARAVTDEADRREFAGAVMDITEQRRAEEERRAHLWFLESMDRVNRAIQGTDDLERMLGDVLEAALAIFDCDRASLLADAGEADPTSFRVVAVRARPAFGGALAAGVEYQLGEDLAVLLRSSRSPGTPVQFTPASEPPLPARVLERFGTRSVLSMAVHARGDVPAGFHHFVVTQCSHPRSWGPHEVRLFHEIGRRLGDALRTLSALRDLRRSEARLEEAQRIAHVGHWEWELDGDRLTCSGEAVAILGLPAEERPTTFASITRRVHPEDRSVGQRAFEEARAGAARVDLELRVVRPGGEARVVHLRGTATGDGAGHPRRMFGTIQDVTERKRAEDDRERLRQAEADLARISRATTMGEFTASLAHEIKQPIAAAITSANACIRWLAREVPELAEARAAAARIVSDATRVAEIVNRVRALYKNDVPRQERVDVNDVIAETLALLRSTASRHGVSMRAELAPDLPAAMGDRVQLQQVLVNLILNGLEAMGAGPGLLRIGSARGGDGALLVTVSDEGVGLPEGAADRIFDAFFTTKPQGTGMGLAISRSIVERHGGRLWATPRPRGTSFHVSLPIAQASVLGRGASTGAPGR